MVSSRSCVVLLPLAFASAAASQPPPKGSSCFLLHDERGGRTTPGPDQACATRVTPASTFKIPHALAALDSGVVTGADEVFRYDGTPREFESWRRDHDLRSAMRDSVVWYFQRVAERLGKQRELAYLKAFDYGNQDLSGPLTSFWLGDSLKISPDEQLAFLRRFFDGRLKVGAAAAQAVRDMLEQPDGQVANAAGEHALAPPWPAGTTVYAKTGRGSDAGRRVAWLVGRVVRDGRAWTFVSCVIGDEKPLAAVELAARRLVEKGVLGGATPRAGRSSDPRASRAAPAPASRPATPARPAR